MAINKNFVIKNGVQVNTDLIVGDSTTNKVGVGTTVPGYTLHVGATKVGSRGGIGATDLNVTGVGTIQNLRVLGVSTLAGNVTASGIVSANQFQIGINTVVTSARELQNITSLDATTTKAVEEAIMVGPNSFSDLKVVGMSTFVGIASFKGGIDVDIRSGVSTFSAPVQFGFAQLHQTPAGLSSNFVAVAATVGFGTSAFFRDNAAIFMGDGSDFKLYHDNTNSYIDNMTGALYVRNSVDDDDNSSIIFQAKSGENSIVMTNSADESNEVELYYDGAKKLQTTSGGLYVTGITTLSDRLYVESGISTFVGDVRFGIGATVGFGTSAFFLDDAAITIGDDDDFFIKHSGGHTYLDNRTGHIYVRNSVSSDVNTSIIFQAKSGENSIVMTNDADESNEVELYYDGAKKLQTTSGGIQITGIATLTDRLHVQSGISTFDADVRFGIGATVGFGTSAFFLDDAAIFMGDDSDLKIHHDGSNSYIQDVGTGDLILQGSADIKLQSASGENYIIANDTGSVDVYFDNSKKLESTSGGIQITGIATLTDRLHVQAGVSTFDADVRYGIGATVGFGTSAFFVDDAAIFLGSDSDLKIHHDGSNSYIQDVGTGDLIIQGSADIKLQSASGENYLIGNDTGSVEVYYDNSKKLESTSGGLNVTGITTFSDRLYVTSGISTFADNAKLTFGTQADLVVYHDGSDSWIRDAGTGMLRVDGSQIQFRKYGTSEIIANFIQDSAVELFFDNSKKVETTSGGFNITGITTFSDRINVVSGVSTFQDNAKLTFGAQSDLQIYFVDTNGSDESAVIKNNNDTGWLRILSGDSDSSGILLKNRDDDVTYLRAKNESGVELFYANTKTFETSPQGIDVAGIVTSYRLNVTGVSTLTNIGSDLIPDGDGSRNIGAAGTEWKDLFIDGTANIDSLAADTAAIGDLTNNRVVIAGSSGELEDDANLTFDGEYFNVGSGVTIQPHGGVSIAGITTIGGDLYVKGDITYDEITGRNLNITGITTFADVVYVNGDVNLGNATSDTITATGRFDSDIVPSTDNARDLGASGLEFKDLYLDGTANIDTLAADTAAIGDLTNNRVVIAGSSGELEDDGNFTFDGDQLKVGLGTIQVNGNAAFAGIVTIGGNLNVTGDIVYDEVSGRNINITGITTLGSGNGGSSGLLVTGAGYVGGGATVGSHAGIITYYGDGANLTGVTIGIGTTGDGSAGIHPVGFGVTYLEFKGAGFTTAYYDGNTGIATLCFQGGGNAGAAGTWVPYGASGIATSKAVGVGTVGMAVTSLQGGVKGASSGIGNSFHGLYIGNGMMLVDNQLNGNHYIGTSYNGMMAGPVTINGILTVDGNYVVV